MISPKGFAFSCALFTIKIKWKYVEEMNYSTQWKNRKQNAFISFKLSQAVAPAFKGIDKEVTRINPNLRLAYKFSDFKNFIETYDALRRSYTAHKNKGKNGLSPVVEHTSQAIECRTEELGTKKKFYLFFFHFHDACKKSLNYICELVKGTARAMAGMHVLVAIFILVFLFILAGHTFLSTSQQTGDFAATGSLLDSLIRVNEFYLRRHYSTLSDFRTPNRQEKEALGGISSEMWVHRLQESATELAERFVFTQLQLTELRKKRANRLLVSDYQVQTTANSRTALSKKLREGWHYKPSSLFSSRADGRSEGSEHTVEYQEQVRDDQMISQVVDVEEANDRHTCLHLASELVELAELAEEVFSQFISILLSDSLYSLSTGETIPHHRSDILVERRRRKKNLNEMENYLFDAELVLKVIRLRRHIESLFHLNPLEPNANRRTIESLMFSELRRDFLRFENSIFRPSGMNDSDKQNLLDTFYKKIVLRNSTTLWSGLRNNVDELLFWHAHQPLWEDHVSQVLSSHVTKEGKRVGDSVPSYLSSSNPTSSSSQWKGLPVFRGLLCFTNAPQLFRGGMDVSQSGTHSHLEQCHHCRSRAQTRSDEGNGRIYVAAAGTPKEVACICGRGSMTSNEDGRELTESLTTASSTEYPLELLRTEATVFQRLSESVMERWINELDIFLEGIRIDPDKPGGPRVQPGVPHFSDSLNFDVRSRLLRIAKKNVNAKSLEEVLRNTGMRSADPSLQSTYTAIISICWDNLKDMPYFMLNSFFLHPPSLSDVLVCSRYWFMWTFMLMVTTVVVFCIYKKHG